MIFIVLALMMLTACQSTLKDKSFMSLKGSAVERRVAPTVIEPRPPVMPAEVVEEEEDVEDHVYFATNQYEIDGMQRDVCVEYARHYLKHGGGRVVIDGHCDERGSRDYNMGLGMRRSAATKNMLVSAGMDASMISIRSFGKEKPIVWGSTEEAWAKNRVAIIRVVS